MEGRSFSADILKAISIFGVVFIHGSFLLGGTSEFSTTIAWIFRFCVPAFIIMWAYFFENSYSKRNKKDQKKYIYSRFKHLFIVYFIWSLIYFIFLANWETLTIKDLFIKHFSGYGFSGQYFFIILFQLLIFYPLIRWFYTQNKFRYVVLALVFGLYLIWGYYSEILPSFINKFGNRPFIFWMPYVFLGIALARKEMFKISRIFVFSIFLIPIEFYFLETINPKHPMYITPAVLISSSLTTIAFLGLRFNLMKSKLNDLMIFSGTNTITVFVANPLIIIGLGLITSPSPGNDLSIYLKILFPLISTVIVFLLCLVLAFLINRSKLKGVLN